MCEQRWMDEHIVVSGKIIHEDLTIIDDNKMGFEFWLNKHISYAKKEVSRLCSKTKKKLTSLNRKTTNMLKLIDFLNYRKN